MEIDYEKEYAAMVQRARELHETGNELTKRQMEIVCPELRESEDERHRKWILEYLYDGLRKADEQFKDHFKAAIDWLEKQKESLHIEKTCKENADSFTDEDERIRRRIIGYLKQDIEEYPERKERIDEMLAYLERQKEQKSGIIIKAFENSKTDYSLEEREEASDYSEKVLPTSITYGENEDEYRLHKIIEAAYIAGQKEQKPPIAGNDFGWIDELKHDLKHPEELDQKVDDVLKQRKGIRALEWSEEDEKELDCIINILDRLGFEEFCKSSRDQDIEEERFYYKEIQFLKRLKSLRPQIIDSAPLYTIEQVDEKVREAQEWSEEDERKRQACISTINEVVDYERERWEDYNPGKPYRPIMKYDEQIDWLKSLRPQSKDETYEEKDEAFKLGKHQLAIVFMNYLDENRPEGKMSLSNTECEDIDKAFKENDWTKIMRYYEKYRPSWKPSEEQMSALNYFIKLWGNSDDQLEYTKIFNTVKSLRDDLKKLGVKEEPEYYQHFDPDC